MPSCGIITAGGHFYFMLDKILDKEDQQVVGTAIMGCFFYVIACFVILSLAFTLGLAVSVFHFASILL